MAALAAHTNKYYVLWSHQDNIWRYHKAKFHKETEKKITVEYIDSDRDDGKKAYTSFLRSDLEEPHNYHISNVNSFVPRLNSSGNKQSKTNQVEAKDIGPSVYMEPDEATAATAAAALEAVRAKENKEKGAEALMGFAFEMAGIDTLAHLKTGIPAVGEKVIQLGGRKKRRKTRKTRKNKKRKSKKSKKNIKKKAPTKKRRVRKNKKTKRKKGGSDPRIDEAMRRDFESNKQLASELTYVFNPYESIPGEDEDDRKLEHQAKVSRPLHNIEEEEKEKEKRIRLEKELLDSVARPASDARPASAPAGFDSQFDINRDKQGITDPERIDLYQAALKKNFQAAHKK